VRPARAESGSSAAAQALFDQGKALMAAGKVADACPKFEESQRLDPGSGTLVNLALCYEKTGRSASAWTTYLDAAAAARAAGNPERERGARERAAALAPKVSKVTVDVPPEARVAGLAVTRNGVAVPPAEWGLPIPTDPGTYEIVAKAPGYESWSKQLSVSGEGAVTPVSVPALTRAVETPAPEPSAPPQPSAAALSTPPASAPEASSSAWGAQRVGAVAAAGVGVAGVVVGSVFGLQAISKKSEADKTCNGGACTSDAGVTAGKDAHAAGNISTVAMIVGAVGLAGGAALWFTAPSSRSTEVGIGPTGLVVHGVF